MNTDTSLAEKSVSAASENNTEVQPLTSTTKRATAHIATATTIESHSVSTVNSTAASHNSPQRLPFALRVVLICLGCIAVALGFIGVFVPVLPTTPFLLLAAACFLRSSARMHKWLLHNRLFGSYLRAYLEGRGIPRRIKIYALSMLWLSIGASAIFAVQHVWLRVLLLVIAVLVSTHLLRIKTRFDNDEHLVNS